MVYPALLPLLPLMRTPRLPVVDWTDSPADLNGLVRFPERPNLVSACVPSRFKRALLHNWLIHLVKMCLLVAMGILWLAANILKLGLTFLTLLMFTGQQNTCDCTAVACSVGLKGTEFSGSNSCITGRTHSQPSRWTASYWSCPSHWPNQVSRIRNLSRTLEPCFYASLFWDITAQHAHINLALTLPCSLSENFQYHNFSVLVYCHELRAPDFEFTT